MHVNHGEIGVMIGHVITDGMTLIGLLIAGVTLMGKIN